MRMMLESRPREMLAPGMEASETRLVTADDLFAFAVATGNHNPLNLPDADFDGDGQPERLASGGFCAALVAAVFGTRLPGPGTRPVAFDYRFLADARAGDELRIAVRVTRIGADTVGMAVEITRTGDGARVLWGSAEVRPPPRARRMQAPDLPGLTVQRHVHFHALTARAGPLPALATAVVWPDSADALEGALAAARATLIEPILVGDPGRIAARAAEAGADLAGLAVEPAADGRAAAARAVALVREGRAAAVMKGHLHTDELLRAMLDRDGGLRTGRRLTHVFVMDVPGLPHPLLLTDAAINIAPDLETKVDIVQNAIDLARSIGIATPRVGVLSAVETVNPAIPSSIDAALLSKMAERGQITGGLVDGPLAMDNAVSLAAARSKGLTSPVAGRAEILVVPGIDAGNMLAKQLTFLAHAEAAGLVLGARVPVILTSRADGPEARLASCAIAAIHHHATAGERR
jgi:phosphate butyryltransferase